MAIVLRKESEKRNGILSLVIWVILVQKDMVMWYDISIFTARERDRRPYLACCEVLIRLFCEDRRKENKR